MEQQKRTSESDSDNEAYHQRRNKKLKKKINVTAMTVKQILLERKESNFGEVHSSSEEDAFSSDDGHDIVDSFSSSVNLNSNEEMTSEDKYEQQLQRAIIPKAYILSIRSKWRFYWDVIVIIFAI